MSDDLELDELERLEKLVRGPGWVPDIDKSDNYEEWTGKWYTPTRPDGTGGFSLALYADDEQILYANYISTLRNAAPRLIRAARHLAAFDKEGIVSENESLRRRGCEVECERDEQRERANAGAETVAKAFDLADKYTNARHNLRKILGAYWHESIEEAAARLATAPSKIVFDAAQKYGRCWQQRETLISSCGEGPRGDWDERTQVLISSVSAVWRRAHVELLRAVGVIVSADEEGNAHLIAAADPQALGSIRQG